MFVVVTVREAYGKRFPCEVHQQQELVSPSNCVFGQTGIDVNHDGARGLHRSANSSAHMLQLASRVHMCVASKLCCQVYLVKASAAGTTLAHIQRTYAIHATCAVRIRAEVLDSGNDAAFHDVYTTFGGWIVCNHLEAIGVVT